MAKGRSRGPTRMDLRREAEAKEAQDREAETEEKEEGEEEEEEAEGEDAEAEAGAEAEGDDDDEDSPKKKKKAVKKKAVKKPAAKKATTKRSRAAKEVRRRAVWVVFDNASKEIQEFPFNQKADAEELLARKIQEKEGKATFYMNLVKREIKDKE